MIYADHLQRAAARTTALGHAAPVGMDSALPNAAVLAAIAGMSDLLGPAAATLARPGCDISLECARLALAALPRFMAATGCSPTLTLGSVAYDGVPILSADVENIRELRQRACYHVWWSLADLQVIDLTLLAHLALLHNPAPPEMVPVVGAPGRVARIRWRPYLLGESVFRELLADDTSAAC